MDDELKLFFADMIEMVEKLKRNEIIASQETRELAKKIIENKNNE